MQTSDDLTINEQAVVTAKATLDAALEAWPGDNSNYGASQRVYAALRAILGREEDPSSYPENHPLVEYAKKVLVRVMRGQMQCVEKELTVFVTAFLYVSLHRSNWKAFLTSDSDKQLFACVLSSYSTVSADIFNRICEVVSQWSGTPFTPTLRSYDVDVSERLFGTAWHHIYFDEFKADARAKYDTIMAMNIPVVFDQTHTPDVVVLPDNMSGGLC